MKEFGRPKFASLRDWQVDLKTFHDQMEKMDAVKKKAGRVSLIFFAWNTLRHLGVQGVQVPSLIFYAFDGGVQLYTSRRYQSLCNQNLLLYR